MIRYLDEISRCEVSQFKTAILPIGATEQHGDFLPLGTDTYLAKAVVDCIQKEESSLCVDILILPVLCLGKSTEHLGIPGTISLSARTLISLLEDIVASLHESGFETLLIVNGHGGNTGMIDGVSYDLHHTFGLDVYSFALGKIFASFGEIGRLPYSMHAGVAETSIMKFCYPRFKDLYARIPALISESDGVGLLENLKESSWGWGIDEIAPNGYVGDPNASSPELGKKLLDFTVDTIIHKIQAITKRRRNCE